MIWTRPSFVLTAPLAIAAAIALGGPRARAADLILNPLSGLFQWNGQALIPDAAPLDHYRRFSWADLEPEKGRYDFSAIDRELAKLPKGHTFAFGVAALNTCCSHHHGVDVPAYLQEGLEKGFFIKADPGSASAGNRVFVPDWNDPLFLDRAEKLIGALGGKYDFGPRIAWVDIRFYGNWGEWHLGGAAAYPGTKIPYDDPRVNLHGAQPGTLASRKRLIDAHVAAFPKTQLVMMTDDPEALVYALQRPTRIPVGMRRESFGAEHFEKDFVPATLGERERQLILERWKTAPVIVEPMGQVPFEVGAAGLLRQVETYHVATIGDGNLATNTWAKVPPDDQKAFVAAASRAGYRVQVTPHAEESQDKAGARIVNVSLAWQNTGVAPVFGTWKPYVELWSGSLRLARAPVDLELRRLLPSDKPTTTRSRLTLPAGATPPGEPYTVKVEVLDKRNYRAPLNVTVTSAP